MQLILPLVSSPELMNPFTHQASRHHCAVLWLLIDYYAKEEEQEATESRAEP